LISLLVCSHKLNNITMLHDAGRVLDVSAIDELEDFAMGRMQNNARSVSNGHHAGEVKQSADDLESFFGRVSQSSSVPKLRSGVLVRTTDTRVKVSVTLVACFYLTLDGLVRTLYLMQR